MKPKATTPREAFDYAGYKPALLAPQPGERPGLWLDDVRPALGRIVPFSASVGQATLRQKACEADPTKYLQAKERAPGGRVAARGDVSGLGEPCESGGVDECKDHTASNIHGAYLRLRSGTRCLTRNRRVGRVDLCEGGARPVLEAGDWCISMAPWWRARNGKGPHGARIRPRRRPKDQPADSWSRRRGPDAH